MSAAARLDLVHTSPVVTTALRRELQSAPRPLQVTTAVHAWTDFQHEWDFAGDYVVVDAQLDDHLPLAVKVRALRRLGSHPIVIGPGRHSPFARRAGAEGATAWIEPTQGLGATADTIRAIAAGRTPDIARIQPAGAPDVRLTDRQLQVLALFVAARGHSPAHLARVLALRTETVRSHIERGRARYRDAGHPTNNRAALRSALVADGWTYDPQVWIDSGRP